jgi:hypothetical protein
MVPKLRLVLKNPHLQLALKAIIFGGFLTLVKLGNFGITPILFFVLVAFLLYSRPIFNTSAFLISFLILIITIIFILKIFPENNFFFLSALFFSLMFYILLGVKNLIFINRALWYLFFNLALFYSVFISFFYIDKSTLFAAKVLILFLALFLLFKEFFRFLLPEYQLPKKKALIVWLLALIVLEIVFAVSLLPLGFINSANLAILSVFILGDLTFNYLKGTLNRRLFLIDITLFVLLILLIFGTTKWEIGS